MGTRRSHQQVIRYGRRLFWGRIFGLFILGVRQKKGSLVEEIAPLAGMEPAEWLAIEAGESLSYSQLRPIAEALELSYDQLRTLAFFCDEAWPD